MTAQEEIALREDVWKSLQRMQEFHVTTLSREQELGNELHFGEVVPFAQRLVDLYKQISTTVIDDLPQQQLNALRDQANSDFNRFQQVLTFSSKQNSPHSTRAGLIQQIDTSYQNAFNNLHQIISYSTSKSADFKRLEHEARATLQRLSDNAADLTARLEADKSAAAQILDDIRKVAAQHGVSQQAFYFKTTAEEHEEQAGSWQRKIYWFGVVLGLYAALTLFLHKIPLIKPDNVYETAQLAISKVLLFGVLSFLLYLATKNYLAHKHNAVVNRHRQNALMTYEAIVNAAKNVANKEVVLTHASSCMFSPQQTGYTGGASPDGPAAKSIVELMTNKVVGGD